MKITRCPALVLACGFLIHGAPANADTYPRQPGVDVAPYAFRLTLADDTDAIEGEAAITFRVTRDGVASLALDLAQPAPAANGRGMTVSASTRRL